MKVLGRKSQSDSVMSCLTDIGEPMAAEPEEKAADWEGEGCTLMVLLLCYSDVWEKHQLKVPEPRC